ncbi:hypothetical protein V6615_16265 (plasmid) [Oscillospiraceae bacterium PP1C4]
MAKKFSTDALMKNFMPVEVDNNTNTKPDEAIVTTEKPISEPLPEKEDDIIREVEAILPILTPSSTQTEKKEKRIPITFNLDESVDEKLSLFVFKGKMKKGKKINKTQVITDALIKYLNENDA